MERKCCFCDEAVQEHECKSYIDKRNGKTYSRAYHAACRRKHRQRPEVRVVAAKRRRTENYNTTLSTASYYASSMCSHMNMRMKRNPSRLRPREGQVPVTKESIIGVMDRQNHQCAICEYVLNYSYRSRTSASPSLDRVNSDDTYHEGNIHVTCVSCNLGKSTFSTEEFKRVFHMGPHTTLCPPKSANVRHHMVVKQRDSTSRGKNSTITADVLVRKVRQQGYRCHYTGIPLHFYPNRSGRNPRNLLYASIDRVDSNKGYTDENTVVCCMFFNFYKKDYSVDEIIARWRLAVETIGHSRAR